LQILNFQFPIQTSKNHIKRLTLPAARAILPAKIKGRRCQKNEIGPLCSERGGGAYYISDPDISDILLKSEIVVARALKPPAGSVRIPTAILMHEQPVIY
jgi:hypothetical protein